MKYLTKIFKIQKVKQIVLKKIIPTFNEYLNESKINEANENLNEGKQKFVDIRSLKIGKKYIAKDPDSNDTETVEIISVKRLGKDYDVVVKLENSKKDKWYLYDSEEVFTKLK